MRFSVSDLSHPCVHSSRISLPEFVVSTQNTSHSLETFSMIQCSGTPLIYRHWIFNPPKIQKKKNRGNRKLSKKVFGKTKWVAGGFD